MMQRPRYFNRRTPGQQAQDTHLTSESILLPLLQRVVRPTLNCTSLLNATARATSCTSMVAALNQVWSSAINVLISPPYLHACLARAGAVLQSRAARGCLQGGKAHWSFQAAKVLSRPCLMKNVTQSQVVDARAGDMMQLQRAAAAAVAALNVSSQPAAALAGAPHALRMCG
jgi:hypothetical protein